MGKKKQTGRAAKLPNGTAPIRPRKQLDKRAAFLAAFAVYGNQLRACQQIGISRMSVLRWLTEEPDFKEKYDIAREEAIQRLEIEARRRAEEGCQRFKFTPRGELICIPDPSGATEEVEIRVKKGKGFVIEKVTRPRMIPYVEHVYSDKLMEFLLGALRPETYRQRVSVAPDPDVPALPINPLSGDVRQLPTRDELIGELERMLLELKGGAPSPLVIETTTANGEKTNGQQH